MTPLGFDSELLWRGEVHGLRTKTVNDDDWHLEFCNFSDAWACDPPRAGGHQMGEGIRVAHPDTGYTMHPELLQGGRYLIHEAVGFLLEDGGFPAEATPLLTPDGGPFFSHGTKTASILMSAAGAPDRTQFPDYNAARFVSGVAPRTKVVPYRVDWTVVLSDRTGIALARSIYHALKFQDPNELGVISISLGRAMGGWIEEYGFIRQALQAARRRGVVICAAAGQWRSTSPEWVFDLLDVTPAFPARDQNVIGVAGCKADYSPMPTGFLGPAIDITAPAYDLWVARTQGRDQYDVYQSWGSSYAAAIVAGACALWQAHHGRAWLLDPANYGPELIFTLFKEVLRRSAHLPGGWDATRRGAGVLDALQLLRQPLPSKAEVQQLDARE